MSETIMPSLHLEAKSVLIRGRDLNRLQQLIDLGVLNRSGGGSSTSRFTAPLLWTKSVPMIKLLLKHLCNPEDSEPAVGSGDNAVHRICREADIPHNHNEEGETDVNGAEKSASSDDAALDVRDPLDDRIFLLLEHLVATGGTTRTMGAAREEGETGSITKMFLSATNNSGHTPVEIVCRYGGSVTALDTLLTAQAPVPVAALHLAAEAGHDRLCAYLLTHVHGRPTADTCSGGEGRYAFLPSTTVDESGVTPLMRAAAEHRASVVGLFLQHQTTLDHQKSSSSSSVEHYNTSAARRLLLQQDSLGRNALHYVAMGSRKKPFLGELPSALGGKEGEGNPPTREGEGKGATREGATTRLGAGTTTSSGSSGHGGGTRGSHQEQLDALAAKRQQVRDTIDLMIAFIQAEVRAEYHAAKTDIRNREAESAVHVFIKAVDLTGLTASQLSLKLDNRLASEILVPLHQSQLLDTAPVPLTQAVDQHMSATMVVASNSETAEMKAQAKLDRVLGRSPSIISVNYDISSTSSIGVVGSGGGGALDRSSLYGGGNASTNNTHQPRYNYSTNVKEELQKLLNTSGGSVSAAAGSSGRHEPTASELWRSNRALLPRKKF